MSANQETMRASIAAAEATKLGSISTAEMSRQAVLAAGGTPAAADAAKRNALFAAEQQKQSAIGIAKDLLRSQGEYGY